MKYFIKFVVLFSVFVGAIYFFGSNMDETVFSIEQDTIEMSAPTLPTMRLRSDGVTINLLHGYTSNLDLFSVREHLITVEDEQTLELLIEEKESDIRKLQYEVLDTVNGTMVAEGKVSAFEEEEPYKTVRLKITEKLQGGREYAARITLITSESKRIYYYFRIKYYKDAQLAEKVDFILSFSENARTKQHNAVIPYLESTYRGAGTSYAQIDIEDSFYMVCWGGLEPKVITPIELSLSEIYSNIAVGRLEYMVELTTDTGLEHYYITEKFRITCVGDSKHLLNYERTMDAVFDVALTSLSQSQFKLGIVSEPDLELVTNSDSSMLAFVRNKELWHYNVAENKISRAFSFKGTEYEERAEYGQHDIRILNMQEDGDISFMVFGYMNCGEYEGKTGIVIYRYYRAENRVEELLYLPMSESYQHIRQELGSFSYMNAYDVFYFMADGVMYSYNLTTKSLTAISEHLMEESLVFSREKGYVAWQEENNDRTIYLVYFEQGEKQEIKASYGEFIQLLGKIDESMICGYGKLADCTAANDGTVLYPSYQIQIIDAETGVQKTYRKDGFYIVQVYSKEGLIRLERIKKQGTGDGNNYVEAEDDYILNYGNTKKRPVSLTSRITELMFLEYYIDLPDHYKMSELPAKDVAVNTVITADTTLRIPEFEAAAENYAVYSFGEIVAAYDAPAPAIMLADKKKYVGTVINGQAGSSGNAASNIPRIFCRK